MVDMQTVRRVTRGGIPGWLDDETGRWLPIMAGAEDGDGDGAAGARGGDGDGDGDKDGAGADGDGDGGDGGSGTGGTEPDWKREARKHERRSKQAARERDELKRQLAERTDADKDERQRAIDAARDEGRRTALSESEKDRRADRLENAVLRTAAKGIKVGRGDDARTVKFDDPEDALVFIERMLAKGELDEDEIFDDKGKVRADALTDALTDLLRNKPRLAAGRTEREALGDADGGKGSGAAGGLDDMSIEDHLKAVKRGK